MMKMHYCSMVLAGMLLPLSQAMAIPVKAYDLSIEFSKCVTAGGDCAATDPVTTGVTYHGSFTIDPTVLETDGYVDAFFQSFYLTLGDFTWDSLNPYPGSDYVGSRHLYNPNPPTSDHLGLWTVLVQDGELAGICCGVFGRSDTPFVDLYSFGIPGLPEITPNFVSANAGGEGRFPFFAQGTFSFKPIPEPASVALFGLGLMLLISAGAPRRQRLRR